MTTVGSLRELLKDPLPAGTRVLSLAPVQGAEDDPTVLVSLQDLPLRLVKVERCVLFLVDSIRSLTSPAQRAGAFHPLVSFFVELSIIQSPSARMLLFRRRRFASVDVVK